MSRRLRRVLGSIQPGPLATYLAAVKAGGVGGGLLQRFQVLVWPDPSPVWRNVDEWPDRDARDTAFAVFEAAADINLNRFGIEAPEDQGIPWLRFSEEAQVEFDEWRAGLEARLRAGDLHPAFEAHLAKYRSLVPSLALIFHVADGEGAAVSQAACVRATAWAAYLESHARRVYDLLLRSDAAAAKALGEKILAGELGSKFTLRDVHQCQARDQAGAGGRRRGVGRLNFNQSEISCRRVRPCGVRLSANRSQTRTAA